MVTTSKRKLVTIVAESVLQPRLVTELQELGISGYTVSEVTGHGSREVRSSGLAGQNIRVEVIASEELAEKLVEHVSGEYFPHYAVICFVSEVEVLRGEKYS